MTPLIILLFAFYAVNGVHLSPTEARKEINTRIGPCTLINNGMKCTERGYFEMVQCDTDGCFCVAAHNGLIAFDTRTNSSKIFPRCSNCYNYLKQLFADDVPPKGTFIPKCDVALGNYVPMQCDLKQEWCYCVNPITGIEINNTRKRNEENLRILCDGIEFRSELTSVVINNEAEVDVERYPVGRESCKLDRDRGVACRDVKPSLRYYFDYDTFACLAFEYLGCGGNENNYVSSADCVSECKLADLSGCSGMYPAARLANGHTIICGNYPITFTTALGTTTAAPTEKRGPWLNEDGCPLGHKCVMGAFYGICCSKANEDQYNIAYHPKCDHERQPFSEARNGWQEIRFGKSCQDNFCPTNYTCHNAEIFSYCC